MDTYDDRYNRSCMHTENIYDEPSLPDPIYQELTAMNDSGTRVEMMGNPSYALSATAAAAVDSRIILSKCPAYEAVNVD